MNLTNHLTCLLSALKQELTYRGITHKDNILNDPSKFYVFLTTVGIVRSRTKGHGVCLFVFLLGSWKFREYYQTGNCYSLCASNRTRMNVLKYALSIWSCNIISYAWTRLSLFKNSFISHSMIITISSISKEIANNKSAEK
jgi:hypothetical protein